MDLLRRLLRCNACSERCSCKGQACCSHDHRAAVEEEVLKVPGMLKAVLECLDAQTVGHLQLADQELLKDSSQLRPKVLPKRKMPSNWSWQKADLVERAQFRDSLSDVDHWAPGPNERGPRNVLEVGVEADGADSGAEGEAASTSSSWLWLSGGTDWQGFQGGFRLLNEEGLKPAWISFRVRVATPELSGAFFTLSTEQLMWGLSDPLLVFSYRGDDAPQDQRRSFAVQRWPDRMGSPLVCSPGHSVVCNRPYHVGFHLNWRAGVMTVVIDGQQVLSTRFKNTTAIRYAAIYNWRSGARTAFSDLVLGDNCPFERLLFDAKSLSCRWSSLRTQLQSVSGPVLSHTKKYVQASSAISLAMAFLVILLAMLAHLWLYAK